MEAVIVLVWAYCAVWTIGMIVYAVAAGARWLVAPDRPARMPIEERKEPRISLRV
jgi:hypothetical protein